MRKLLSILAVLPLAAGCQSTTPVGPGAVTITETTTSTSTSTTTTSTIPLETTAQFSFSPVTPQELQVVNFNAAASRPGTDRRIVSYVWDFGDGVTKTGITSTHDYFPTGIYLVTLTVTDDAGTKATRSDPITVRPAPPAPATAPAR